MHVRSESALILQIDNNIIHNEMKQSPQLFDEIEKYKEHLEVNGTPQVDYQIRYD